MADNDSRSGVRYTTPEILAFVERVHAGHDAGLARAFQVPEGIPAIMVGPSEGKLLEILMRMIGARKIVEVGTLAGYSAVHLARGLPPAATCGRSSTSRTTPRSRAATSTPPASATR